MAFRKFTVNIPATLNDEQKIKSRKALDSVMEILQEVIDENSFQGNSKVKTENDVFEITWQKARGESINRATVGMLLEMEIYDVLPMQHEVLNAIAGNAILV